MRKLCDNMQRRSKLIYFIINLILLGTLVYTFSMISIYKDTIRVLTVLSIMLVSGLQLQSLKKVDIEK